VNRAVEDGGGGGEGAAGLIFQWKAGKSSHWRLAGMIGLALLAHAVAFYALQVAYTPTGSSPPAPAQVVLLAPDSPEQQAALTHWLDLADPAAMTQPSPEPADSVLGSLGFHYVPSYASVLQSFKPLAAGKPALPPPPRTRKPGPVPMGLLPPVNLVAEPGARTGGQARTRLAFSGAIQGLAPENATGFHPAAPFSAKPLDQTVFLVGVPPQGGAAWIFRQASSGDMSEKGADALARDYLARLIFRAPPAQTPPAAAWGWATVSWGSDAYQ
jgi:hypothetical protein